MKIGQSSLSHVKRHIVFRAAIGWNLQTGSDSEQFVLVFDGIVCSFSLSHFQQRMGQVSGMSGMRRCTSGNGAVEATGNHRVCCGAANTCRWSFAKWIDPARSLQTVSAAKTGVAETALGLHGLQTVPYRGDFLDFCFGDHLNDRLVDGFGWIVSTI
jgi:hypothetical protein